MCLVKFYVLHFASPSNPIDYLKLPIQTLKVESLGTHKALGLVKEKKAVFLHQLPKYMAIRRSILNRKNIGEMSIPLVLGEFMMKQNDLPKQLLWHIEARIVRLGYSIIPTRMRIDDGRALPTFVSQALTDKGLTVFGDGSQTRSFCFVSDLINGIYKLLLSDIKKNINIGNPSEITIKQFAEEVIVFTNSKSEIVYKPIPEDDPQIRQPDISKAKTQLGWEPVISREEGLLKTIKYFKEKLKEKR